MVGTLLRFLASRGGSERVSVQIGVVDGTASLVTEGGGDAMSAEETEWLLHRLVRPGPTATGWQLAHPELFIARGVAEAHGGSLSAASPINGSARGVRLTLALPAA
jgi:hypothetical protein